MTTITTKTYQVTVIERALAFYEVEAEDARTAAENWQDGEYDGRDDEALDTEGPCTIRERQPDGSWRKLPQAEWQDTPPAAVADATDSSRTCRITAAAPTGSKPYSVLLLYPDYANDGGSETYYAWVTASDPLDAVAVAQRQAAAAQIVDIDDPTDFAPLLVTQGHHYGEALFNK